MSLQPASERADIEIARGGTEGGPWLVALDIDGTLLHDDGLISDRGAGEVRRLDAAGHQVMLATGRSWPVTIPVLDRLGIRPRFLVCSNGAVTLERDPAAASGYRRELVKSFDPTDVLRSIHTHVASARFAVEDEHGHYRYTDPFPDAVTWPDSRPVEFGELSNCLATRVLVMSSSHDEDGFLTMVKRLDLTRVCWAIGWTAWLDIAADGVNKATAMERVRGELGIPRDRVMAVADGRNDIELLRWASEGGRGVAMGQSPAAVIAAAGERTASVYQDGLAKVLATL